MNKEDFFYSVNKLVEFAQADKIQKQMTQSMNEVIAAMRIPGVDNPRCEQTKKAKGESEK